MSQPIPSATVVTLREKKDDIEILMLRKNSKIAYGGSWVFPGGKIDAEDYDTKTNNNNDIFEAARVAASREAKEEADIDVDSESLHFFSHWTTPPIRPKRFSTWFFIGKVDTDAVTIDGGEIHDFSWRTPKKMLQAHSDGEVELMPPTFITLTKLQQYNNYDSMISDLSKEEPLYFAPRIFMQEHGMCHLYDGDAGYETENPDAEGKHHRLLVSKDGVWDYKKEG